MPACALVASSGDIWKVAAPATLGVEGAASGDIIWLELVALEPVAVAITVRRRLLCGFSSVSFSSHALISSDTFIRARFRLSTAIGNVFDLAYKVLLHANHEVVYLVQ